VSRKLSLSPDAGLGATAGLEKQSERERSYLPPPRRPQPSAPVEEVSGIRTMVRDARNVAPTVRIICKYLAEVLAQVLGQLAEC
jgi:hypothetical protein